MWSELTKTYAAADPRMRNPDALRGFICEAHLRDQGFSSVALKAATDNPDLAPRLPYFQASLGVDTDGIMRLRRAIASGHVTASDFRSLANRSVANSQPQALTALLHDIATLPNGVGIALDILHMHFHCADRKSGVWDECLIAMGRDLLTRTNFAKDSMIPEYGAHTVIRVCLAGDTARPAAQTLCINICAALDRYQRSPHNLTHIFKALIETQPFVTLDAFLLRSSSDGVRHRFDLDFAIGPSIEDVDPRILHEWASSNAEERYPLLGQCLSMFRKERTEEQNEMSPLFLSMLTRAPDKGRFLGDLWDRVHPRGWSGSLAYALTRRKELIMKLREHSDARIRAWVNGVLPALNRWIDEARASDRGREESFE